MYLCMTFSSSRHRTGSSPSCRRGQVEFSRVYSAFKHCTTVSSSIMDVVEHSDSMQRPDEQTTGYLMNTTSTATLHIRLHLKYLINQRTLYSLINKRTLYSLINKRTLYSLINKRTLYSLHSHLKTIKSTFLSCKQQPASHLPTTILSQPNGQHTYPRSGRAGPCSPPQVSCWPWRWPAAA